MPEGAMNRRETHFVLDETHDETHLDLNETHDEVSSDLAGVFLIVCHVFVLFFF